MLVLLLIVGFLLWWQAGQMQFPENSRIKTPAVSDPVKIEIDSSGLAYITATNEADLITGQGFFMASRKLWQMEIMRRAGKGTLSEVFGDSTRQFDIMFRNLRLDSLANAAYRQISDQSKNLLECYTAGVNLFLNESGGRGYSHQFAQFVPGTWHPQDSFILLLVQRWLADDHWKRQLLEIRLRGKLSSSAGPISRSDGNRIEKPGQPDFTEDDLLQLEQLWEVDEAFRKWMGIGLPAPPEVAVALKGTDSTARAQLVFWQPFSRYAALQWEKVSLHAGDLHVAGLALLGIPGVLVGRNEAISWTSLPGSARGISFVPVRVDFQNKSYQMKGFAKPLTVKRQYLNIERRKVPIFIYGTDAGPILNLSAQRSGQNRALVIIIPPLEGDFFSGIMKMNHARDESEFTAAVNAFRYTEQQYLCADSSGRIFSVAPGTANISRRSPPEVTEGADPKAGRHIMSSPRPGTLAAMQKIILGSSFEGPCDFQIAQRDSSRKDRIDFRVSSSSRSTNRRSSSFNIVKLRRENDVRQLGSWLKALNDKSGCKLDSTEYGRVIWLLRQWNGVSHLDDVASTVYWVWRWMLIQQFLGGEIGDSLMTRSLVFPDILDTFLDHRLSMMAVEEKISNAGAMPGSKISVAIREAFCKALLSLQLHLGDEVYKWQMINLLSSSNKASMQPDANMGIYLGTVLFARELIPGQTHLPPPRDLLTIFSTDWNFPQLFFVKSVVGNRKEARWRSTVKVSQLEDKINVYDFKIRASSKKLLNITLSPF